MSPDPNDEYFAEGMTEELITALSGVSELTVIARTSVMHYKNSPKRVVEVGKELGTGTIIEGSVRKAANRIRITVQIVDATNEGHLWARNYDRQMDDIFAIQSEIAEKVADALELKLIGSAKRRLERRLTGNTEAYDLYLKGKYYWNKRTKTSIEKGISYLLKAIEKDPNFALAYSDLADAYVMMADYAIIPADQACAKIEEYATRALQMDPSLSQPHAALAYTHQRNFQWKDNDRELEEAIALNPNNAAAHHFLGLSLFLRGMHERSIQEWRKAKELDPLSLIVGSDLGYALVWTGHAQEGLELQQSVIEMEENFLVAHRGLAISYLITGRTQEAFEQARKLLSLTSEPYYGTAVAAIYAMTGHKEEAWTIMSNLIQQGKSQFIDPAEMASAYAALGEDQKAMEWLETAVNQKSAVLAYVNIVPSFDKIRDNPRFKALVTKVV